MAFRELNPKGSGRRPRMHGEVRGRINEGTLYVTVSADIVERYALPDRVTVRLGYDDDHGKVLIARALNPKAETWGLRAPTHNASCKALSVSNRRIGLPLDMQMSNQKLPFTALDGVLIVSLPLG